MAIGLVIFCLIAVWLTIWGVRLLRDPTWGNEFVERTTPRVFRMGTVDTHRRGLGVAYVIVGILFFGIGLAVLATLA